MEGRERQKGGEREVQKEDDREGREEGAGMRERAREKQDAEEG